MLGPSPDWFVGVHDISMVDASGNWYQSIECRLFGYDAGTDNGTTFSLSNTATSPHANIVRLENDQSLKNAGHDITDDFAILKLTLVSLASTDSSTTTLLACP